MSTLIVGIDEAGYGPNLGPLVVAATAWQVEGDNDDLYRLLADIVSPRPLAQRLAIGDSKTLYKPGGSLDLLEQGVLACRAGANVQAAVTLGELLDEPLAALPWYQGYDPQLPLACPPNSLIGFADQLAAHPQSRPLGWWAQVIEPAEFNAGVARLGSKGALLSEVSVRLAATVIECCASQHNRVLLQFDKHGGRNRYAAILQHWLGVDWPETIVESRGESRYRWTCGQVAHEATFCARGESRLPTALASMVAKYLRELCMQAFNNFWCGRIAGLRPTAGYPLDARRFRTDIETECQQLQLTPDHWWRCC
jgi:ribonuclease HII